MALGGGERRCHTSWEEEPHLSDSGFPSSPLWPVPPLHIPLLPLSPSVPADPTPISCLGPHVRGGRKKKEKGKEFYQIFSRGERTPPFESLPHGDRGGAAWGPLTNSVAPSPLPCRANPAGTTYAKASLLQHSCLTDKNRPPGPPFLIPLAPPPGSLIHLSSTPSFSDSVSSKAQGKGCQTAADKLLPVLQKQIKRRNKFHSLWSHGLISFRPWAGKPGLTFRAGWFTQLHPEGAWASLSR